MEQDELKAELENLRKMGCLPDVNTVDDTGGNINSSKLMARVQESILRSKEAKK